MTRSLVRPLSCRPAGLVVAMALAMAVPAAAGHPPRAPRDETVVLWNQVLLDAVRDARLPPPPTARALAIVHTCMYDAWAAYDASAVGWAWSSSIRRPRTERTLANKRRAVSHAAHRALVDLFPAHRLRFDAYLAGLGLDPADDSLDPSSPAGIAHLTCRAVLAARHDDGANQLGDRNGGAPYSDYTGYTPFNTPELLVDPNRWQPLRTADGTAQAFLTPHWGQVKPFAVRSVDQFRPAPPYFHPDPRYEAQAEAIRRLSAGLGDREKVIAEYWADGPGSVTPPGHWSLFAQFVSRRDRHDLDADVRLFFLLGNAMLDASIAVWDCKVAFDYVRPVSAVRYVFASQTIAAWGGPHQGTREIPAERFVSYLPTPPFAEYTSGHSAFSAAAATILEWFTGNSRFGASHTTRAGGSVIEPGSTPSRDVTLSWRTFRQAADEAGLSRRYGGIHFARGDLESRVMGRRIARAVWVEGLRLFTGDPHTLGPGLDP